MAQWIERRCIDLVILTSRARIPLWDVDASPLMRSYKPRSRKKPLLLKAVSDKHRSKFAALSVNGNGDSRRIAENLLKRL
jgi:hypothetical protein